MAGIGLVTCLDPLSEVAFLTARALQNSWFLVIGCIGLRELRCAPLGFDAAVVLWPAVGADLFACVSPNAVGGS